MDDATTIISVIPSAARDDNLLLAILIACLWSTSAVGQEAPRPQRDANGTRFVMRALTGGAGLALGTGAGVLVSRAFGPYECDCQYPGLKQTMTAVGIGAVVGSALGASWFGSHDACTRKEGFKRALRGAIVTGVVGLPWFVSEKNMTLTVWSFAIPMSSAYAMRRC